MFWVAVLAHGTLWTLVPLLFYAAPPGEVPLVLAVGREWLLGSPYGPPLAYWLANIALTLGGIAGVYLLSQFCVVATFWAVFALGRRMRVALRIGLGLRLTAPVACIALGGDGRRQFSFCSFHRTALRLRVGAQFAQAVALQQCGETLTPGGVGAVEQPPSARGDPVGIKAVQRRGEIAYRQVDQLGAHLPGRQVNRGARAGRGHRAYR